MGIRGRDREFRLPKITYLDFKHIEMDRVLTQLFPRLRYDGYASRRVRKKDIPVEEFVKEFLERPEWFEGFSVYPNIVARWIETDLLDIVNRGKPNQAVASPRPLHGNIYKFRNARYCRDYFASEQIYWMIYYARQGRGQAVRDMLSSFFFTAIDLVTDQYDSRVAIDVETQALLRLDPQVEKDMRDSKQPGRYPPLCIGQSDILADDILRLMAYRDYMPRSVLVDYLKTLLAFHLAIYHLRLLKLVPAFVQQRRGDPLCDLSRCPVAPAQMQCQGDCPHRIGILVEMGDVNNSLMQELAQKSADLHYRRIPTFVHAHYILKKLDEMAEYLSSKVGKMSLPAAGFFSVPDLLQLLQPSNRPDLEAYFKVRLVSLVEDASSDAEIDPEIRQVSELGLDDFETYMEILMASRAKYHRQYITESLDSLLLKNRDSGLLAQSRRKPRRFVLGGRLLEVLLQIAVLTPNGSSFETRPLLIEDLLLFLKERYGLYIDRLPDMDSPALSSLPAHQALRLNTEAFKKRLREIGFFQDLSDAYITQMVTPRYTIRQNRAVLRSNPEVQQ
ncbi:MAG: hypothetical protein AAGU11_13715 [Syntrophobacteraceae bacterium]